MNKKFLSLLCAALLVATTAPTHATFMETLQANKTPASIGLGLLGFSFYKLYSRTPVKNFTARYNLSKLLAVDSIFSSSYWDNLWYLYEDAFIGQCAQSSKLKCKDGDGLEWSESAAPHGVLGTIDANIKPIEKSLKSCALMYAAYRVLTDGDRTLPGTIFHKGEHLPLYTQAH